MSFLTNGLSSKIAGFTLLSAMVLSACAGDPHANRITGGDVDRATGDSLSRNLAAMNEAKNLQATGRPSNVVVRDGIYLGRDGFRANNGDPLPNRYQGPRGISVNLARAVDIVEFAEVLERMTRIQVDWSDLMSIGGMDDEVPVGEDDAGGSADSAQPFQIQMDNREDDGGGFGVDATFKVNFTGSLSDLLTYVASRVNADWTYRGGRIQFLGPQTRTYTLWSMPTTLTANSSIANENSAAGEGSANFGGAASMSTTSDYSYEYWETIESGLAAILPELGARYSVNQSSGTIIVTGNQASHDRVSQFITTENQRLSRQVNVKVDIVAFQQNDSNMAGVNADAISSVVNDKLSLLYSSEIGTDTSGAAILSGVFQNDPGSATTTAQGFFASLAQYGRVSVVNSQSVVANNNTPTPVSLLDQTGYVASSEVTIDDSGNALVTYSPGTITTGLSLLVTPRILSSGEVVVSYTMNTTELRDIQNFGDEASGQIQLPSTSTRTFMQTVNIESGDSMLVAAYDGETNRRTSQGPFSPAFWGLGGNSRIEAAKTKVFLVLTPVVLEGRNNPRGR